MSSYLAVVGHKPARLHERFYLAGRELHHKRVVNDGIRCELVIPGWRLWSQAVTVLGQCQPNQFVTNLDRMVE